jgi:hypothetical protein
MNNIVHYGGFYDEYTNSNLVIHDKNKYIENKNNNCEYNKEQLIWTSNNNNNYCPIKKIDDIENDNITKLLNTVLYHTVPLSFISDIMTLQNICQYDIINYDIINSESFVVISKKCIIDHPHSSSIFKYDEKYALEKYDEKNIADNNITINNVMDLDNFIKILFSNQHNTDNYSLIATTLFLMKNNYIINIFKILYCYTINNDLFDLITMLYNYDDNVIFVKDTYNIINLCIFTNHFFDLMDYIIGDIDDEKFDYDKFFFNNNNILYGYNNLMLSDKINKIKKNLDKNLNVTNINNLIIQLNSFFNMKKDDVKCKIIKEMQNIKKNIKKINGDYLANIGHIILINYFIDKLISRNSVMMPINNVQQINSMNPFIIRNDNNNNNNYDIIHNCISLLHGNIGKNKVKLMQSNFFYYDEQQIPACGEETTLNLCNTLLWNFDTNDIDISKLDINCRLYMFYTQIKKKFNNLFNTLNNDATILTLFVNICLNKDKLPDVSFSRNNVEIIPTCQNILKAIISLITSKNNVLKNDVIYDCNSQINHIKKILNNNHPHTFNTINTLKNITMLHIHNIEIYFSIVHGEARYKKIEENFNNISAFAINNDNSKNMNIKLDIHYFNDKNKIYKYKPKNVKQFLLNVSINEKYCEFIDQHSKLFKHLDAILITNIFDFFTLLENYKSSIELHVSYEKNENDTNIYLNYFNKRINIFENMIDKNIEETDNYIEIASDLFIIKNNSLLENFEDYYNKIKNDKNKYKYVIHFFNKIIHKNFIDLFYKLKNMDLFKQINVFDELRIKKNNEKFSYTKNCFYENTTSINMYYHSHDHHYNIQSKYKSLDGIYKVINSYYVNLDEIYELYHNIKKNDFSKELKFFNIINKFISLYNEDKVFARYINNININYYLFNLNSTDIIYCYKNNDKLNIDDVIYVCNNCNSYAIHIIEYLILQLLRNKHTFDIIRLFFTKIKNLRIILNYEVTMIDNELHVLFKKNNTNENNIDENKLIINIDKQYANDIYNIDIDIICSSYVFLTKYKNTLKLFKLFNNKKDNFVNCIIKLLLSYSKSIIKFKIYWICEFLDNKNILNCVEEDTINQLKIFIKDIRTASARKFIENKIELYEQEKINAE